jgi:hypothetical protein
VRCFIEAEKEKEPLLGLSFFWLKTYCVGGGGSIYRIGFGAIPFLLPLMLQLRLGLSPSRSGMLTGASAIGSLFIPPIAKRPLGSGRF